MPTMLIYLLVLTALICLTVIRILLGPTVWDRLIGAGLIATKVTIAGILAAVYFGEGYLLDIALVFALLGFLVNILIARFIEGSTGPQR